MSKDNKVDIQDDISEFKSDLELKEKNLDTVDESTKEVIQKNVKEKGKIKKLLNKKISIKKKTIKILFFSILSILVILFSSIMAFDNWINISSNVKEFEKHLADGVVTRVEVKESNRLLLYRIDEGKDTMYPKIRNVKILSNYFEMNPDIYKEITTNKDIKYTIGEAKINIGDILFKLIYLTFILAIVGYLLYIMFGMNRGNLEYVKDEKSRFDDVGGLLEVKNELRKIISYLTDRDKLKDYVDKIPKGILFEGDPGNGKTMLARVIAGESKTPFFYISGADIEGSFVAQGAGRVNDIFKKVKAASKKEGGAILFIDELDSIGTKREKRTVVETNQTINAILTQLDGFNENENILVIGATNLASQLDSALVRSGRFDRIIKIPNPSKGDRKEIMEIYLKKKLEKVSNEIIELDYLSILSEQTEGFSGSDLSRLINDAFLMAFEESTKLKITHLREAYLRIVMGLPNTIKINNLERMIVAYHESAHAVVSMELSELGYKSFAYGTIRPYGDSVGHVSLLSNQNVFERRSDYFNRVKVLLAGRAIEDKLLKGDFTSGAVNDLKEVNSILYDYVTKAGMSEGYENLFMNNDFSDIKAMLGVQQEVSRLREDLYKQTKELINTSYDAIDDLANYFLENNDIDYDEIVYKYAEKYPEKSFNLLDK